MPCHIYCTYIRARVTIVNVYVFRVRVCWIVSLSLPWKYVFRRKFTPFTWLCSYHRHFLSFPYIPFHAQWRIHSRIIQTAPAYPPVRILFLCVRTLTIKCNFLLVVFFAIQNSMENNIISLESFNVSFQPSKQANKQKQSQLLLLFFFTVNLPLTRNSCYKEIK